MNELQKLTSIVSRIADALGDLAMMPNEDGLFDDALGFGHAVLDDLKDTISTFKAEEKNRRIIRVDGSRTISLPLSTLNCIKC